MRKLLSILLTTAILFGNEEGSNYFVDNFLKLALKKNIFIRQIILFYICKFKY